MKPSHALFPILLAATLLLAEPDAPPSFEIQGLAWMAGDWQADRGQATVDEHWTRPAGGTMLGTSRTVAGRRTVEFEFLRIEQRADGIFYVAQPGGRPPTDFRLVRLEKQRVVFENLQHDFPQRIIYERRADGSLLARIEGDVGGKLKAVEFLYRPME
jgi:hypothetical protein